MEVGVSRHNVWIDPRYLFDNSISRNGGRMCRNARSGTRTLTVYLFPRLPSTRRFIRFSVMISVYYALKTRNVGHGSFLRRARLCDFVQEVLQLVRRLLCLDKF